MRSRVYLAFTVIGLILPAAVVGVWIADHGLDVGELLESGVENLVALAVFCDLALSGLVFFYWSHGEAQRLGMRRWGLYIPAALLIGVCFAFPLFLYNRERAIEAGGSAG